VFVLVVAPFSMSMLCWAVLCVVGFGLLVSVCNESVVFSSCVRLVFPLCCSIGGLSLIFVLFVSLFWLICVLGSVLPFLVPSFVVSPVSFLVTFGFFACYVVHAVV